MTTTAPPPDPYGWLLYWRNKRRQPTVERAIALSLIRGRAGDIYEFLVQTDVEASAIVRRYGWIGSATPASDREQCQRDWGDPMTVQAAVRTLMAPFGDGKPPPRNLITLGLSFLRRAVGFHAPQNAAAVPDDPDIPGSTASAATSAARSPSADANFVQAFQARHGRLPGALTPEALAERRQAANIAIPVPPRPGAKPVPIRRPANDLDPPPDAPFPRSGENH